MFRFSIRSGRPVALLLAAVLAATATRASAHAFGNVGVDHYMRLTPQADRLKVEFDEHFGELLSAVIIARLDQNHDGTPDEAEMARYLGVVRKTLPARFFVVMTDGTNRVELRLHAPTNLNEAVDAYLAEGEGGQKTVRTKWKLYAPWPDWALQPAARVTAHFQAEFGNQKNMSQIALAAPDAPWVVLASDVPSDRELPPPRDVTLPVANTNNIPIVRRATLELSHGPPSDGMLPATGVVRADAAEPTAPTARMRARAVEGKSEGRFRERVFALFQPPLSSVSWGLALVFCLAWGTLHAFSPGHGKTIVSAYLIGMRAKWTDAVLVGLTVTFTHTAVVFVLAVTAFMLKDRFVYPQWLAPLGAVIILLVGVNQIRMGLARLVHERLHAGGDAHDDDDRHTHWGVFSHRHGPLPGAEVHTHGGHTHSHGGHTHVHPASAGHTHGHSHPTAPAGAALAKRDILAIGLSGGLVPCPAAIIMLLMAWQLGQPALGLACLISFSVGLALSLMSVGILAVAGTALVLRWASRGEANTRHQEVIAAVMPIIGGIVLIVCGAIMLQRM